MESHPLDELARELRAQGYPRSYIARLRDELRDHLESAIEEGHTPETATEELGDGATLAATVDQFPALKSWPQRSPLTVFVVMPGLLISAFTVTCVFAAARLAQGELFPSEAWNHFAIQHFELGSILITAILAGGLATAAIRARTHWSYLAAAMLLLAASGLFVIDIASCGQSGSSIAYSRFGLDSIRLVLPLGILAATCWYLVGRRPSLSVQTWARMGLGMAAGLAVFAFASQAAVEQARRHPAQNLVDGLNGPARQAYLVMEILVQDSALDELGVSLPARARVNQFVNEWYAFSQTTIDTWQAAEPRTQGFAQLERDQLQPRLLETKAAIDQLLSSRQRNRLQQLVYRQLGWEAPFLFEVSHELGLSAKQQRVLKDLLLDQVRRRPTQPPSLEAILTQRQLRRLAELQGRPAI